MWRQLCGESYAVQVVRCICGAIYAAAHWAPAKRPPTRGAYNHPAHEAPTRRHPTDGRGQAPGETSTHPPNARGAHGRAQGETSAHPPNARGAHEVPMGDNQPDRPPAPPQAPGAWSRGGPLPQEKGKAGGLPVGRKGEKGHRALPNPPPPSPSLAGRGAETPQGGEAGEGSGKGEADRERERGGERGPGDRREAHTVGMAGMTPCQPPPPIPRTFPNLERKRRGTGCSYWTTTRE